MSYNWVDASTKQGLERFKELGDMKLAVITRSGDGTLSECFCEPDGTIVINQIGYEDWEDAEENNAFFSLEFLDPSPAPVAVADENGLLPCPFCGGKGMYEVFDEIKYSNVHDIECGIQCQGCYTSVKIEIDRKKNTREYAKTQAIALWNRRAGKETNP